MADGCGRLVDDEGGCAMVALELRLRFNDTVVDLRTSLGCCGLGCSTLGRLEAALGAPAPKQGSGREARSVHAAKHVGGLVSAAARAASEALAPERLACALKGSDSARLGTASLTSAASASPSSSRSSWISRSRRLMETSGGTGPWA